MIYNEEYRRRIYEGFKIPREKWIVRTELFEYPITESEWYKEWAKQAKEIKLPKPHNYTCIVCGESCTNWFGRKVQICPECRQWAEGYRSKNKTLNLFMEQNNGNMD